MLRSFFVMQTMPLAIVVLAGMMGATTAEAVSGELNPVARVIVLLKKMKKDTEADVKTDGKTYDKQACWCETNRKEKEAAVANGMEKEATLQSEIATGEAKDAELKQTIADAKEKKTETENSLKEAEQARATAGAESRALQKSLSEDINALHGAVVMMNGETIATMPPPTALALKKVLRHAAVNYEVLAAKNSTNGAHFHSSVAGHIKQLKTAFLSMGSESVRANSEEARVQALSREFLDALDVAGPPVQGNLPIDLAEKLVGRAAEQTGKDSAAFLQQRPERFTYRKQSGRVFETLRNMLDEMTNQFVAVRNEEFTAQEDYKALRDAKNGELDALFDSINQFEDQETKNMKELSDNRIDLEQTTTTKELDVGYLRSLDATCKKMEEDYTTRADTRSKELRALSEALRILTEDNAREHLYKTVSFLQTSESKTSESGLSKYALQAKEAMEEADMHWKVTQALKSTKDSDDDLLSDWHSRYPGRTIRKSHRPERSAIAMLQADGEKLKPMPEVVQAIDGMVNNLLTEHEDEIKFKADCYNDTHKNEVDIFDAKEALDELNANLDLKNMEVEKADEDIKTLNAQLRDLAQDMEEATQNREADKKKNSDIVADQQQTQNYMNTAVRKLKEFYENEENANPTFIQSRQEQIPKDALAYAPENEDYSMHSSSKSVIQLINTIIYNSEQLVVETNAAERDAKEKFDDLVHQTSSLKQGLEDSIHSKELLKSSTKADIVALEADIITSKNGLKALQTTKEAIHDKCWFLMKNFHKRQDQRMREVEGLRQAKAFLSGSTAGLRV